MTQTQTTKLAKALLVLCTIMLVAVPHAFHHHRNGGHGHGHGHGEGKGHFWGSHSKSLSHSHSNSHSNSLPMHGDDMPEQMPMMEKPQTMELPRPQQGTGRQQVTDLKAEVEPKPLKKFTGQQAEQQQADGTKVEQGLQRFPAKMAADEEKPRPRFPGMQEGGKKGGKHMKGQHKPCVGGAAALGFITALVGILAACRETRRPTTAFMVLLVITALVSSATVLRLTHHHIGQECGPREMPHQGVHQIGLPQGGLPLPHKPEGQLPEMSGQKPEQKPEQPEQPIDDVEVDEVEVVEIEVREGPQSRNAQALNHHGRHGKKDGKMKAGRHHKQGHEECKMGAKKMAGGAIAHIIITTAIMFFIAHKLRKNIILDAARASATAEGVVVAETTTTISNKVVYEGLPVVKTVADEESA